MAAWAGCCESPPPAAARPSAGLRAASPSVFLLMPRPPPLFWSRRGLLSATGAALGINRNPSAGDCAPAPPLAGVRLPAREVCGGSRHVGGGFLAPLGGVRTAVRSHPLGVLSFRSAERFICLAAACHQPCGLQRLARWSAAGPVARGSPFLSGPQLPEFPATPYGRGRAVAAASGRIAFRLRAALGVGGLSADAASPVVACWAVGLIIGLWRRLLRVGDRAPYLLGAVGLWPWRAKPRCHATFLLPAYYRHKPHSPLQAHAADTLLAAYAVGHKPKSSRWRQRRSRLPLASATAVSNRLLRAVAIREGGSLSNWPAHTVGRQQFDNFLLTFAVDKKSTAKQSKSEVGVAAVARVAGRKSLRRAPQGVRPAVFTSPPRPVAAFSCGAPPLHPEEPKKNSRQLAAILLAIIAD